LKLPAAKGFGCAGLPLFLEQFEGTSMDRRHSHRRFWRSRNRLQKATAKVSFAHNLEMLEARQLLAADVVISEIMFHPSGGDDGQEYI